MPRLTLLTVYNSLAYSLLTYSIIFWGGIARVHTNSVQVIQNKILRIILNVQYNNNHIPLMQTNLMYKTLNLLKIEDIYKLFLFKFVHFVLYERIDYFEKYFFELLPLHNYSTRNNIRINLPYVRLNIEKSFVVYQCCILINTVEEQFLLPQSKAKLKKCFKDLCISNY